MVEVVNIDFSLFSFRLQETLDRLAEKLEAVYNAAGGKKINIITHSMGGLLVKCFMCLHTDVRHLLCLFSNKSPLFFCSAHPLPRVLHQRLIAL